MVDRKTGIETHIELGPLPPTPLLHVPEAGAVVCFEGVVRPMEEGRPIAALEYEVYEPMTSRELASLADEVARRYELLALRVEHSTGRVAAALRSLPRSMFSILAKGGLGRWLFHVSADWIGEADMEAMVQEGKGLRKIQKRILIALNGIDENAKLVAQESRMHLWDLRHLNAFMDYYDLPKIIITAKTKTHDTQPKQDGPSVGAVAQGVPALESL